MTSGYQDTNDAQQNEDPHSLPIGSRNIDSIDASPQTKKNAPREQQQQPQQPTTTTTTTTTSTTTTPTPTPTITSTSTDQLLSTSPMKSDEIFTDANTPCAPTRSRVGPATFKS